MNSNETDKLCGQPHWWAWPNSPDHAHPPPILIDGDTRSFFLFYRSNFFFKLFHWICNLFPINAAEPENRGRPNAFLSATSRTGGCVIQHTDTVRRISNSPTLPLLRSVGCSLNAQHIGFWVRDDRTKRSAANSRNVNAEIRAIFRLPRHFAAEPSTGSSWTQKIFDRAWKELSTGVQLT